MLDALKEISGLFDRRFLLYQFVPTLAFCAALMVIWFAGRQQLSAVFVSWNQQEAIPKVVEVAGSFLFIFIFASVLAAASPGITRFYEGYWRFPFATALINLGRRRHLAEVNQLQEDYNAAANSTNDEVVKRGSAAVERIYYYYPIPEYRNPNVMPTRLGNILKSSELYARDRYQIDSVLIWPRLYELLPERITEAVAVTRANMDFMLLLASLSTACACLSGAYLIIVKGPWWLFLGCLWGGLLLGWIMYRTAISAALNYASTIKTAFDLYRERVLQQMRLPLPKNEAAEKETWNQVNKLFYQRRPLTVPYVEPFQDPDD